MELRDQSVGSIDKKQKAVNSVDVDNKNQTENENLNESEDKSENRQKAADYKEEQGKEREPATNCDSRGEKDKPNEQNKDNAQEKETRKKNKKREDEKNGAVNENKAKVPAAGNDKGTGKSKRKIVIMDDSFEETDGLATPRAVELQEADQSQNIKISELQKQKAKITKSRPRKSIVVDGDDAYSCRSREILREVKWRPDRYSEKLQKLEKENGMTVYEKMKLVRKENPILKKRIDDEMEAARPNVEGVEFFIDKLRKERKGLYHNDEDLYGSDESDTETRMKEARMRSKSVPDEKVNDVMESRRAAILKQMTVENEKLDEITRKQEEMRRFASRSTKYQCDN